MHLKNIVKMSNITKPYPAAGPRKDKRNKKSWGFNPNQSGEPGTFWGAA